VNKPKDHGSPTSGGEALDGRLAGYREKLLEAAVMTLPLALVSAASDRAKDQLLTDPWKILWIVLPLTLAAWLTLRAVRLQASRLDWRWFVFLAVYCSVFALSSASDLLVWRRTPTGFYQGSSEAGREWLVPLWLGDWRYWVVRRAPAAPHNIAVLLYPPVDHTEKNWQATARLNDRGVILLAATGHAAGIAFDVSYDAPAAPVVDQMLCAAVKQSGMTVLSTYDLTSNPNDVLPKKPPTKADAAVDCLQVESQGHAMGWADGDHVVRTIPLYWEGDVNAPAFSVRIARQIHAARPDTALTMPRSALLRFVPPVEDIPVLEGAKLASLEKNPLQLRNYFLIVGELSKSDRFETPFGLLPGAVVHAYAAHSLLTGNYMERPPVVWSVFVVFASCYVLTLLASRGIRPWRLAFAAAGLSAAILVCSAAAMYLWSVWVDVIYAVVAIWLLVPLLVMMQWKWRRPGPAPQPP